MEEVQKIFELSRRRRKNCRICGEEVAREEPVYMDGYTTVHMECYFDFQAQEVTGNECAV